MIRSAPRRHLNFRRAQIIPTATDTRVDVRAEPFDLRAGELRLQLNPAQGGSIAGLWHGDLSVLCGSEPDAAPTTARQSACYPMAPFTNRLALHRFRWLGVDHTLAAAADEPGLHAIHGMTRSLPWRVASHTACTAELRLAHRSDAAWPFSFEMQQQVELTTEALNLRLTFTNTDAVHHQPVGLGFHPRFTRRARSRLHIELSDRWDTDPTGLPTRRQPQSGIDADVAHLDWDHCFEGWCGVAKIRDEKLRLSLASSMPYLMVSTPSTQPWFCVEPMSQVSNAMHMADPLAHGLRKLAPGESMEAWMTLNVAPV